MANPQQPPMAQRHRGPGMYAREQQYFDQFGTLPPDAASNLEVQNGIVTSKPGFWDKYGPYLPFMLAGGALAAPAIGGLMGAGNAVGVGIGGSAATAPAVGAGTAATAAGTGAGVAKAASSWLGPALSAGAGTVNSLLARNSANKQQQQMMAALEPFLNYQKYLIAMSDPQAASYLGIAVPQGAQPMRQNAMNALYQMLPLFARQGQ